ncbi:hypothetical protein OQA88_9385 [Cercophora sp. LCS_1]
MSNTVSPSTEDWRFTDRYYADICLSLATAFSGACAVVSTWAAANGFADKMGEIRCRTKASKPVIPGSADLPANSPIWSDVLQLYNRRWFSRLWVIQEIALAQRATVIWGDHEMAWEWIGLAASIIRTNWNKITPERIENSSEEGPSPRLVPPGVMNAYFMYRISPRRFGCTSTHDKVFGLLGLTTTDGANKLITPDYRKPISTLYRDIATAMIHHTGSLDLLSHARLDTHLYSDRTFGPDRDLPSWVPTWDTIRQQTLTPLERDHCTGSFQAGLAGGRGVQLGNNNSPGPDRLVVRGKLLEHIRGARRCFYDYEYDAQHARFIRMRSRLDGINPGDIESDTAEGKLLEGILSGFGKSELEEPAMTLTAGKTWYGTPVTERRKCLADFATALLNGRLWHTLRWSAFGVGESGSRLEDEGHRPAGDVGAPWGGGGGGVTLDELKALARGGNEHVFMDAVSSTFGPIDTEPGDKLCIIYGTRVPFVVRWDEARLGFRLVGECYVDDYMHGEAVEDGRYEETWVELD